MPTQSEKETLLNLQGEPSASHAERPPRPVSEPRGAGQYTALIILNVVAVLVSNFISYGLGYSQKTLDNYTAAVRAATEHCRFKCVMATGNWRDAQCMMQPIEDK